METRAIVIFPRFEGLEAVERIRRRYDPQVTMINAHIALVFPFSSRMTRKQLRDHINIAVSSIEPFTIEFQGITGHDNEYMFLNVIHGNEHIFELHDRLYEGVLSEYRSLEHEYIPHITVGRIKERDLYKHALLEVQEINEKFVSRISEISVFNIDKTDRDPIEDIIGL